MLTFTDASGEILYTSHYKIIDNIEKLFEVSSEGQILFHAIK